MFAKSNPVETIRQHTDELLERYETLKRIYQDKFPIMSTRDWELLKMAVEYHDIGKADPVFQNKIRAALQQTPIAYGVNHSVQHNFLSVLMVPYKQLGLEEDEKYIVSQAIAYHHERKIAPDHALVMENFKENIKPIIEEIEKHMNMTVASRLKKTALEWVSPQVRIKPSEEIFDRYVMIKGLLHRLDHSASAHVPVEMAEQYHVGEYVTQFINDHFNGQKRELQQFAEQHQNNHLVVLAQTGMGKTEAGLLWIGQDKGFFTLPLRVSINAMYKRIKDPLTGIGFTSKTIEMEKEEQAIGLLHSTAMDYLYEENEGHGENLQQLELVYAQSRQFANKLIISTIDQLFKFPFYYKGFEKELAVLAGAKIVIDELQSYNPRIAALLIRGLQLIDHFGGKFMIMTATMPHIYLKALRKQLGESRVPIVEGKFFDDSIKRHHIKLEAESILDLGDDILAKGETKKVLVICNTVRQATKLYEHLVELNDSNVPLNLLHAMFIRADRSKKEAAIKRFADSEAGAGVWITTQLVEASLDIDFDVMFTEMSALDSQFQRYGRCNRKAKKEIDGPNIFIATEEVSGVGKRSVYHPEIYHRSLDLLREHDNQLLTESKKMELIESLYDDEALSGTDFRQEFESTLHELSERSAYEIDRDKAQHLLRDIAQVQVIPEPLFKLPETQLLVEEYRFEKDLMQRRKLRMEIESLSVGVNKYLANSLITKSGIPESLRNLYVMECGYSNETGLQVNKQVDPFS